MTGLTSLFTTSKVKSPIDDLDEEGALTTLRAKLEPDMNSFADALGSADILSGIIRSRGAALETTLLRMLRYQNRNVRQAEAQFRAFISWRESKRIGSIPYSIVREVSAGCPYSHTRIRGEDDTTLVFSSTRHYNKRTTDAGVHEKATIKAFDEMLYSFQARSVVAVMEFEGSTIANVDLATRRRDVNLFFSYYPEMFEKFIVMGAPRYVISTWNCILKPLFNERTVKKVKWCTERSQVTKELETWFEKDQIPTWLGGDNADIPLELFYPIPDPEAYQEELTQLYKSGA